MKSQAMRNARQRKRLLGGLSDLLGLKHCAIIQEQINSDAEDAENSFLLRSRRGPGNPGLFFLEHLLLLENLIDKQNRERKKC